MRCVLVPPQIIPFDFGEESVNEGEGVSLQCTVSKGDYPLNITWALNDRPISSTDGIVITRASKRVSTLSIDYVTEHHGGNYTCIASNRGASSTHAAFLAINGIFMLKLQVLLCY